MDSLAIGDTVRLASGGPLMTVQGQASCVDGSIWRVCTWFDDGQRRSENFLVSTLRPDKNTAPVGFGRPK